MNILKEEATWIF